MVRRQKHAIKGVVSQETDLEDQSPLAEGVLWISTPLITGAVLIKVRHIIDRTIETGDPRIDTIVEETTTIPDRGVIIAAKTRLPTTVAGEIAALIVATIAVADAVVETATVAERVAVVETVDIPEIAAVTVAKTVTTEIAEGIEITIAIGMEVTIETTIVIKRASLTKTRETTKARGLVSRRHLEPNVYFGKFPG
jgi:hypothetical protein